MSLLTHLIISNNRRIDIYFDRLGFRLSGDVDQSEKTMKDCGYIEARSDYLPGSRENVQDDGWLVGRTPDLADALRLGIDAQSKTL